ncbi:BMP family ABC transporter substrate-binding protein [Coriobacteriales bacterium OH1046]|nr:BMP family ABC transporter substrate-binding protein [Coriobacteriales bacterium OH1046]
MSEAYDSARKAGRRQMKEALSRGESPFLPSLDGIIPDHASTEGMAVGTIDIPLPLVVGTRTRSRSSMFSCGFLPIADPGSEFAVKWSALYDAQVSEGIRDPIVAYEYLQRFYVAEGNKRVSVLRWLDNPTITARVARVMPRDADETEAESYREFLEFYRVAPIYGFFFSAPGSFARMARLLGRDLENPWPPDEAKRLGTAYRLFERSFEDNGGDALPSTAADAFLIYLQDYATSDPLRASASTMDERVRRIWDEFVAASPDKPIDYVEHPPDGKPRIIPAIRSLVLPAKPLRVAFIYDRSPQTSGWVALHERGRIDLEKRLVGQVETIAFPSCSTGGAFDGAVEAAIADGSALIVTSSPRQFEQTVRAAVAHPDRSFINCSINLTSSAVRTFYARMYEIKFVMGALAASLAKNHRIGYLAFSPIYGSISEVNAFALGAALVDPYATVHLRWLSASGESWERELLDAGVSVIAGRDHPDPTDPDTPHGLYRIGEDGSVESLAIPVWDWGRYYELIVRSIKNDTWQKDGTGRRERALNYWWGMSSGVVRLDLGQDLAAGQQRLAGLLAKSIVDRRLHPFEGAIFDQRGTRINPEGSPRPSNEQIASMRWLNGNIVGRLPKSWELSRDGRDDVEVSGVISRQTDEGE